MIASPTRCHNAVRMPSYYTFEHDNPACRVKCILRSQKPESTSRIPHHRPLHRGLLSCALVINLFNNNDLCESLFCALSSICALLQVEWRDERPGMNKGAKQESLPRGIFVASVDRISLDVRHVVEVEALSDRDPSYRSVCLPTLDTKSRSHNAMSRPIAISFPYLRRTHVDR